MDYAEAKAAARTMGYYVICNNMTGVLAIAPDCPFGWRILTDDIISFPMTAFRESDV